MLVTQFKFQVAREVMEEQLPPPSPRTSPVVISDCIEELLKLILSSSIEETLEIDLNLSKHYCSHLLQNDLPVTPHLDTCGGGGGGGGDGLEIGVPQYPLYKRLASTLHGYLTSNSTQLFANSNVALSLPFEQVDSLKDKKDSWNKLVLENGPRLLKTLKAVDFEIHVQEPYFSQLRAGLKTVEGRCAIGDYKRIQAGALLLFNKSLLLEVQDVKLYTSFSKILEAESLQRVLPGVKTIPEGVHIYRKFYTEEKENSNGVVAICVSKPASQPYISLASIVSGLSYEGLGSLLGLMHTVGTVPDALPPPRSSLLSSFLVPHKPNVSGSSLTEGARALSKHVIRASSGWWGEFDGNDSNKNEHALQVISHLITRCCWINIHVVQPHGDIFEIRVAEGYGARWTKDGSKFIGFVEPHMDDGHKMKWKH